MFYKSFDLRCVMYSVAIIWILSRWNCIFFFCTSESHDDLSFPQWLSEKQPRSLSDQFWQQTSTYYVVQILKRQLQLFWTLWLNVTAEDLGVEQRIYQTFCGLRFLRGWFIVTSSKKNCNHFSVHWFGLFGYNMLKHVRCDRCTKLSECKMELKLFWI